MVENEKQKTEQFNENQEQETINIDELDIEALKNLPVEDRVERLEIVANDLRILVYALLQQLKNDEGLILRIAIGEGYAEIEDDKIKLLANKKNKSNLINLSGNHFTVPQ